MIKKVTIAEKIMKAKNSIRETEEMARLKKEHSINEGVVFISGDAVEFGRKLLVHKKVSMIVPSDIANMDIISAEVKYQEPRPDFIYICEGTLLHILFSVEMLEDNESLETVKDELVQAMRDEGSEVLSEGVLESESGKVPFLSFNNQAVDRIMHNVVFFLWVENRLVIGTINFDFGKMEALEPVVKQMLESIYIEPVKQRKKMVW